LKAPSPPPSRAPVNKRSDERKTLLELLAGGGRHIAAALAALLVYPIIARVLSVELLGAWALLSTAGFLLSLSDLGLTTAVHRAAVTQDHARARRAVGLALFSVAGLGPLLAAASYAFLLDLPAIARAAQGSLGEGVGRAAVVVLAAGFVSALAGPYRGFALARGGVAPVATARALSSMTQLAVTAVAVVFERSLLAPAAGYLAGALVELALSWKAASAIDPAVPRRPTRPTDRAEAIAALRDGAAALTIGVAAAVAIRVDVFVLSTFAPLAVVAAYGVASRAVDVSYLLAKQSTVALMPRLGDASRREVAVRVGVGGFGGVVAAGMMALGLAGQPLLIAWVGPAAEGPVAARALTLLALAAIVQATSEVPASMLTLSSRTAWASAIPIALGSAINITISLLGAPHYGVWAVAGSTLIGNAVTCLILWRRAQRVLGWSVGSVIRTLATPLAAGGAAAALAGSLYGYSGGRLLPSLGVCAAAVLSGLLVLSFSMWRSGWKSRASISIASP
jgi:O-antigen/teichoic acid export membrane protein